MAEIKLGDIRVGFGWAAEMRFPVGFLAAPESVRMKLRKYVGAAAAVVPTSVRLGDVVTLSLTAAQTAGLAPGSYIGEAIVYQPASPATPEIPLTNNRYVVEVDRSPSE